MKRTILVFVIAAVVLLFVWMGYSLLTGSCADCGVEEIDPNLIPPLN